jgi:hypothetical protein
MRKKLLALPSIGLLGVLSTLALTGCSDAGRASMQPLALTPSSNAASLNNAKNGSLYVASRDGISVYGGKNLEYSRTITDGVSLAEAIDFNSRAQLFVANENSSAITVYKARGSSPIRTLTNKFMKDPHGEAISPNNDVYVLSRDFVNLFVNGRQNRSKKINISATAIAIDPSGKVYIPTGAGVIDVLGPAETKPTRTIGKGLKDVTRMAIDTAGNLYVGQVSSSHCGSIVVYNAATGKLEDTITNGVCDPNSFAFDSQDDLYVSNYAAGFSDAQSVTIYSLGGSTPTETITNGINGPVALAIDSSDNLYVANLGVPGNVAVYPPDATSPSRILTKDIDAPVDLQWLP